MSEQYCRLLDLEYPDPYYNIALEEAIMSCVGKKMVPCTLRYWRNTSAAVIGAFQCAEQEVNITYCHRKNIPVIRRISGGGAVYHDQGNLNYSIFMAAGPSFYQVYQDTSLAVANALCSINVTNVQVLLNTILINNRKVSGLAGAMKSGVILIHGSLLVDSNLDVLSDVLHLKNDYKRTNNYSKKFVKSNKMKVTNLKDSLFYDIAFSQVKDALQHSFENVFSIKFIKNTLNESEKELATELYHTKYRLADWNFKY